MKSSWSGSLSFGLVNIPVKLYGASMDRSLDFKLFDKNGNCPISYVRVCRESGKEIPYRDIAKGYEYKKGDFVVLKEEDFKKAAPKKTELVEITQFSDENDIDIKYFEKPYYIEPDSKSAKAYFLLRDALLKTKKVGVAKFVMRNKEHVAIIQAEEKGLILHQLRYSDEIKNDFDWPKNIVANKQELEIAIALIKKMQKKFEANKFHDTYTEDLLKIIEAKAKGKTTIISVKSPYTQTTSMKDLMKQLKKSLNEK